MQTYHQKNQISTIIIRKTNDIIKFQNIFSVLPNIEPFKILLNT